MTQSHLPYSQMQDVHDPIKEANQLRGGIPKPLDVEMAKELNKKLRDKFAETERFHRDLKVTMAAFEAVARVQRWDAHPAAIQSVVASVKYTTFQILKREFRKPCHSHGSPPTERCNREAS